MSVIGNTMGNEFTLNHLIPLIMNLLNDDNPEVKLHVLGSIGQICHQVGPNLLNGSLIDIINDLIANSPHWRVRESIVKLSADLGTSVGLDNFVEKL